MFLWDVVNGGVGAKMSDTLSETCRKYVGKVLDVFDATLSKRGLLYSRKASSLWSSVTALSSKWTRFGNNEITKYLKNEYIFYSCCS